MPAGSKRFEATVAEGPKKRPFIQVPFNPDELWGPKDDYRVAGTIGGHAWRGSIVQLNGEPALAPGPAWWRDCGRMQVGATVEVEIHPEGPQRDDLAPDFAAALEAEPKAGQFFDSLAQFYRKAYLAWIDATKRKPDLRAERISRVIGLLKAGEKQRPR